MWTKFSCVLSQCSRLTDRQTNGEKSHRKTASASWNAVCIPCSAVKIK